jgi:hypothetical protein
MSEITQAFSSVKSERKKSSTDANVRGCIFAERTRRAYAVQMDGSSSTI